MKIIESSEVSSVICNYPVVIQKKLHELRSLILESASELKAQDKLEETLKWGEPAYISKSGSTIRINWKQNNPEQYAMYFHCKTKLVDTFRERYKDIFNYEGNRAIVFNINDKIPVNELKNCIKLALRYHTIKHLPMLGL